ncbi:MAG: class I SAM-dependent methyltransferase, partial [Dehalobacterium sp.]
TIDARGDNVTIYQGLAQIYDKLMESVNYEEWAQYMKTLSERYKKDVGSALDIACGTGNTSISLARLGWRVTGVDFSLPMLQQARRKAGEAKLDIIFLQQDIRELELTREYDLVTCFQDGLNYLLAKDDLESAFRSINKTMSKDGLFIFDLNLVEKYSFCAQGDISFVDTEEFSLVYETSYLTDQEVWEIKVTGFVKEDQRYAKFQEIHQEKQHHLKDVEDVLHLSGFKIIDVFNAFSLQAPAVDSRRIFIVAQKVEGRV